MVSFSLLCLDSTALPLFYCHCLLTFDDVSVQIYTCSSNHFCSVLLSKRRVFKYYYFSISHGEWLVIWKRWLLSFLCFCVAFLEDSLLGMPVCWNFNMQRKNSFLKLSHLTPSSSKISSTTFLSAYCIPIYAYYIKSFYFLLWVRIIILSPMFFLLYEFAIFSHFLLLSLTTFSGCYFVYYFCFPKKSPVSYRKTHLSFPSSVVDTGG